MKSTGRSVTDVEIARRCLTCRQGKWEGGKHVCLRRVCKYRTSRKSAYWIGKEGV